MTLAGSSVLKKPIVYALDYRITNGSGISESNRIITSLNPKLKKYDQHNKINSQFFRNKNNINNKNYTSRKLLSLIYNNTVLKDDDKTNKQKGLLHHIRHRGKHHKYNSTISNNLMKETIISIGSPSNNISSVFNQSSTESSFVDHSPVYESGYDIADILKQPRSCYSTNEVLIIIGITCALNFAFVGLVMSCVHFCSSSGKDTNFSRSDSQVFCDQIYGTMRTTNGVEILPPAEETPLLYRSYSGSLLSLSDPDLPHSLTHLGGSLHLYEGQTFMKLNCSRPSSSSMENLIIPH